MLVSASIILCGCTQKDNLQKTSDGRLKVIATSFPQYDFVREIAGDKVDLSMLISPGAEVHTFEPTPKDIMNISSADIFVYTGGESDEWAKSILDSTENSKLEIISFMDSVNLYEEEHSEGMQTEEHGETGEAEETEYDEHVWTSPKNAMKIAQHIADVLCKSDFSNSESYRANCQRFVSELSDLDQKLTNVVADAKRKTIVVGDRFPFLYLAKDYGIEYFAAFPGCASNTEASASTIAYLINKVKDEEIPAVFHIEFSNEKIADTICESTGAKPLLLHSCHNVSKDDFESGVTYLDLMKQNIENLSEALN